MLVEMHSRVLPGSPTRRPFAATSTTSRDCATVAHAHWRTVDMLRSERRTVSRHVASWHHYAWETPLCGGCAVGAFVTSALRSPCSHDAWNFHCVPCDCVRCGALEGVVLAVWRDSEREAEGVHVATGESHRALSAPLVLATPLPCRTVPCSLARLLVVLFTWCRVRMRRVVGNFPAARVSGRLQFLC